MKKIKITVNVVVYEDSNNRDSDYEASYVSRSIQVSELDFDASSRDLGQALMGHLDDEVKAIAEAAKVVKGGACWYSDECSGADCPHHTEARTRENR